VQRKPIASAGEDRLINDTSVFLSANKAVASTGLWNVVQGTGGIFSDATNPNSKFTGTTGNYTLQWTLTNACGSSTSTTNVQFINNQYYSKIVIVDNTDVILSTPTDISNGNYNIQFNAPVPVIDNQTLLVGTVGNGFLRKVSTVTQNGNTFTMTTTQGKLQELFVDGGFELGNVFKIDSILPTSRMSSYRKLDRIPTRGEILSNPKFQTGVHYYIVKDEVNPDYKGVTMQRIKQSLTPSADPENPVFKFGFNNTLYSGGGFDIKAIGGITFTPNVYADFKASLSNVKFNAGLNNATLVSNLKFKLVHNSTTNLLNHEFTLFSYDRLVYFQVGLVPILINCNVRLDGKVTADVTASLTSEHEFVNTLTTKAGISHNNGTWTTHYSDSVENTINNNLAISGSLEQTCEIGPKLSFKLYDLVGSYIDAKLTEDFKVCASNVNAQAINWKADLDIGAKITVGVNAAIPFIGGFDFSETWEERELYTVEFPHSIEYTSGNNQQYAFGNALANPVKVRVMSNKGFPIPGAVVRFELQIGGVGTVSLNFAVTDINGYAQTVWTPNGVNSVSRLHAIVQDCNQKNILYSPLVFNATENAQLNCTQTTLYASYVKAGNILSPTAHMGVPPYQYSLDNINFSSLIPQITMTNGGNYTATVRDNLGCKATMNFYNGPINCNTTDLKLATVIMGRNIQATAALGNPPYFFALDGGAYTAVRFFNNVATGTHVVRVKDSNGCVRSSNVFVTNSVNNLVAYFDTNNAPTTTSPLEFTNLSNNATTYLWNFGDNTTSTQTNPTKFYNTAGTYTVTLTAYNGTNNNVFTKTIVVTTATTGNIMGIATVAIPGGTFMMGSPSTEPNRSTAEVLHQVTLSPFTMSKYEITCAQYAAFLNAKGVGSSGIWSTGPYPTQTLITVNASYGLTFTNNQWTPATGKGNAPMAYVNWFGAVSYAQYAGGRLPTESEWEWAARGNTTTAFSTGACLGNTQANYWWPNPQTGCTNTSTAQPNTTQTVGTYPANAFGLHDMHGNVWEWCADWYGAYPTAPSTNPAGPATGSSRVLRGGSWSSGAQYCRSANRDDDAPSCTSISSGFRLVF
jgi:formylglycine-generating enzyme required for sulfatase activity